MILKRKHLKSNLNSENDIIYKLDQIKEPIRRLMFDYPEVSKVILFGSYCNGNPSKLSDIDLIVDTSLKGLDFFELKHELQSLFVKDIDLIRYDELSELKRRSLLKQSEVIYELKTNK